MTDVFRTDVLKDWITPLLKATAGWTGTALELGLTAAAPAVLDQPHRGWD